MQSKTKRQIIEERRGIHRGTDGKIVLTEEQKRQRLAAFEGKHIESETRAARCKVEIRAMREELGMPLTFAEKVFSPVPAPIPLPPPPDPKMHDELAKLRAQIGALGVELDLATTQLEIERQASTADSEFQRKSFEDEISTRWKPLAEKLERREQEIAELMERLNRPSWWRRALIRIQQIWKRNG